MIAWLKSKAAELIAIGAIGLAGWLGFLLLNEQAETRHLTKQVTRLEADNKDLVADRAQCRTNVATLQGTLAQQNDQILILQRDGDRRKQEAAAAVAAANAARAAAEKRAGSILAHTPQGATPGDRMLDVDARFLETLK